MAAFGFLFFLVGIGLLIGGIAMVYEHPSVDTLKELALSQLAETMVQNVGRRRFLRH